MVRKLGELLFWLALLVACGFFIAENLDRPELLLAAGIGFAISVAVVGRRLHIWRLFKFLKK
jgi:hypothetical protein